MQDGASSWQVACTKTGLPRLPNLNRESPMQPVDTIWLLSGMLAGTQTTSLVCLGTAIADPGTAEGFFA